MKNKRTFVMGDIHGEYDKFVGCLEIAKFDPENDTLIQLGDIVDRGPKSFEIVEHLLKLKNLIAIRGNHDYWWGIYLNTGKHPADFHHGGRDTHESYRRNSEYSELNIPQSHKDFFNNQRNYYVDKHRRLFVHGGFNRHYKIDEQPDENIYFWDRDLLTLARQWHEYEKKVVPCKDGFKEIFVGHTPTQYIHAGSKPVKFCNLWVLDTGCGKWEGQEGPLSIMDVDTKEYWQC